MLCNAQHMKTMMHLSSNNPCTHTHTVLAVSYMDREVGRQVYGTLRVWQDTLSFGAKT